MIWNKLRKKHYFEDPVKHIHAVGLIETVDYDKLYENQNNLNHQIWKSFSEKYKLTFQFKEDITKIDTTVDVIALWFFKERADRNAGPQINLAGKLINYFPNTFLLTQDKNIKIIEEKKRYIRRPFLQLGMSNDQWEKLLKGFR